VHRSNHHNAGTKYGNYQVTKLELFVGIAMVTVEQEAEGVLVEDGDDDSVVVVAGSDSGGAASIQGEVLVHSVEGADFWLWPCVGFHCDVHILPPELRP
jgi:hypothetical protein